MVINVFVHLVFFMKILVLLLVLKDIILGIKFVLSANIHVKLVLALEIPVLNALTGIL